MDRVKKGKVGRVKVGAKNRRQIDKWIEYS